MDTGRIKMENFKGILYCDAYMNDEFTLSDLESMRAEIRDNYSSSTDVILKKSGSYSVSAEAQAVLWEGIEEFRNFVYVADEKIKKESAEYAAENYMMPYNTRVASSKEEAYAMLSENH
jgi:hypothetical protein